MRCQLSLKGKIGAHFVKQNILSCTRNLRDHATYYQNIVRCNSSYANLQVPYKCRVMAHLCTTIITNCFSVRKTQSCTDSRLGQCRRQIWPLGTRSGLSFFTPPWPVGCGSPALTPRKLGASTSSPASRKSVRVTCISYAPSFVLYFYGHWDSRKSGLWYSQCYLICY